MKQQLLVTGSFALGFLFILYLSEYIYQRLRIQPEYTRKFAHTSACLGSLLFPLWIHSHWYILLLGLIFFLVLYLTKRQKKASSIHGVQRQTMGSYLLPAAIYLSFFLQEQFQHELYFILPILILGISDPLAGALGTAFRKNTREIHLFGLSLHKTYLGSSAFLLSAWMITMLSLSAWGWPFGKSLYVSLLLAFVATMVELISSRGLDNLTVPLSVIFLLWYFNLC